MGHEVEWPDPSLIFRYGPSQRTRGKPWEGTYVDSWGCEWVTAEFGVLGEVHRVRRALDTGRASVVAQMQFGKLENIEAASEAWLE